MQHNTIESKDNACGTAPGNLVLFIKQTISNERKNPIYSVCIFYLFVNTKGFWFSFGLSK
jgi:hypothetical protein